MSLTHVSDHDLPPAPADIVRYGQLRGFLSFFEATTPIGTLTQSYVDYAFEAVRAILDSDIKARPSAADPATPEQMLEFGSLTSALREVDLSLDDLSLDAGSITGMTALEAAECLDSLGGSLRMEVPWQHAAPEDETRAAGS